MINKDRQHLEKQVLAVIFRFLKVTRVYLAWYIIV